jgi:transcriptional regulator with XRE-family HTH domain
VSQQDVAELTGLTQTFISLIERYRNIPLGKALESLRQTTGLPTDAFIRPQHFLVEQPDFLGRGHSSP